MTFDKFLLTASVHVSHGAGRVQRQVDHPQTALAAAGREQQGGLDVDTVLLGQLVVVFDLA